MNDALAALYDDLGDWHFWLRSRYELLQEIVTNLDSADTPRALEVGCGSGHLLQRVADRVRPWGVDTHVPSLKRCRDRTRGAIVAASSAETLPFESATFDVVLLVDVLEHVAEETQALGEVSRLLVPGGHAVFSVPAYQFLYGQHDRSFGHLRRYTRPRLVELLGEAGLSVQRATYIQPLFFLPLWIKRKLTPGSHDFGQIPGWLNSVLYGLLSMERRLLRWCDIPFGPTLIAVVRKPLD